MTKQRKSWFRYILYLILFLTTILIIMFMCLAYYLNKIIKDNNKEIVAELNRFISSDLTGAGARIGSISLYMRPFKMGISVVGIIEENSKFSIHHKNPLLLYYNLLERKVHITYKGSSIIKYKPYSLEKSEEIRGDYALSVKINFWNILMALKNRNIPYSKFLGDVLLTYKNVDVIDLTDNTKTFHQNLVSYRFKMHHNDNTNNIPQHRKHLPKKLELDMIIDIPFNLSLTHEKCKSEVTLNNDLCIKHRDTIKPILRYSTIYGMILPFQINYKGKHTIDFFALGQSLEEKDRKTFTFNKAFQIKSVGEFTTHISQYVNQSSLKLQKCKIQDKYEISSYLDAPDDPNESNVSTAPVYAGFDINNDYQMVDCDPKEINELIKASVQDKNKDNVPQHDDSKKIANNEEEPNTHYEFFKNSDKYLQNFYRFLVILLNNSENVLQKSQLKIKGDADILNDAAMVNLQNFDFFIGDSGIHIKSLSTAPTSSHKQIIESLLSLLGETASISNIDYSLQGSLSLIDHNSIIDTISEFYAPKLFGHLDMTQSQNILDSYNILRDTIYGVLKHISVHPKSNNVNEMQFQFNVDTHKSTKYTTTNDDLLTGIKIGGFNVNEIAAYIYNQFYLNAALQARKSTNKHDRFNELMPDLQQKYPDTWSIIQKSLDIPAQHLRKDNILNNTKYQKSNSQTR